MATEPDFEFRTVWNSQFKVRGWRGLVALCLTLAASIARFLIMLWIGVAAGDPFKQSLSRFWMW